MLQIDLKSRKSIYEQIVDGCKELIVAGVMKPDEKLPSVRDLSAQLTVNPNTIQKAYRELERQGWIYSSQGLGSFVNGNRPFVEKQQIRDIYERIGAEIRELSYLGVSPGEVEEEIIAMIRERRGFK